VRGGVRLVTDLGRRRRHPPWLTPSPVSGVRWIGGECVVVCIWSLIWGGSVVRTRSEVWVTDLGEKKKTLRKERKENFNLTGQPFITHGSAFHHTGQPAACPSCSPTYLRARLAGLERATG